MPAFAPPSSIMSRVPPLALLLWGLLLPTGARARSLAEPGTEADAEANAASPVLVPAALQYADAPLRIEPPRPAQRPLGRTPVTGPRQMALDAPVPTGAWAVYGAFTLVPLGGLYGASRVGGERLWVTTAQTAAGSVVGSLPGSLLFLQPPEAGGRWAEADVVAFGTGLVLTPPLAALGTWGVGELSGGGGPGHDRGRAFLGALGGAAVGTLLGVAMHGVMEEVVGNRDALKSFRKYVALGFIGSGSTLGYQLASGRARAPLGR